MPWTLSDQQRLTELLSPSRYINEQPLMSPESLRLWRKKSQLSRSHRQRVFSRVQRSRCLPVHALAESSGPVTYTWGRNAPGAALVTADARHWPLLTRRTNSVFVFLERPLAQAGGRFFHA